MNKIDEIDALLPQTQCGLCEYKGCRPYAEAIAEQGENIDRCPPGGTEVLFALADLLKVDPSSYIDKIEQAYKPPSVAVIREDECIGCTKCIQACPTDAILGSGKLMHTVISDACTGCELCIEPCPVDCIDMVAVEKRDQANEWRTRYQKRNTRLSQLENEKKHQYSKNKTETPEQRRSAIQAAIERAKKKRQYG